LVYRSVFGYVSESVAVPCVCADPLAYKIIAEWASCIKKSEVFIAYLTNT
jgi:hypothetical protein